LARILNILEQRCREVQVPFTPRYQATHLDERVVVVNTVEDLLQLDNTIKNPITQLIIGDDFFFRGDEQFQYQIKYSNSPTNNISINISGPNSKFANQAYAEVEEQVERTLLRNWFYRSFNSERSPFLYLFAYIVSFIGVTIAVLAILNGPNPTRNIIASTDKTSLLAQANQAKTLDDKINFLFEYNVYQLSHTDTKRPALEMQSLLNLRNLFIALPILIGIGGAIYAIKYCYPRAVFLWGDYELHYQNLVSRRRTIWNVVIGALLIGIIVNLFTLAISGSI